MICLICRQAEIVERSASVTLERGEFRLVVSGVPGRVCPSCGEAYVDEDVAAHLLRIAQEMSEVGMLDIHFEYNAL